MKNGKIEKNEDHNFFALVFKIPKPSLAVFEFFKDNLVKSTYIN